ncbi:tetratricopeptide repeat protein [Mesobacillus maritimus]|uniref:tetratricopeptide repeat protein n=1 Tax=Mesobacillus maritimus TaxID=1643336 RepID=UPI00203EBE62|nr:tetratricopeptide repeat protein [Mesobacillus maritimus]MCM3587634.1 tetratricopeptide repeat protein [Mesobacillus maritimus]MCM3669879.1 tetratricopeptide repeat protein [Mesobacillus maritimus]
MKKPDSKKDNIVLFPGLERRLLEKGLMYLQEKKYRQAIEHLEQARSLEEQNSEVYTGLVLAYFESGHPLEAKKLAAEMLKEGIGDYFQVMDLYIMMMIQMNEYDQVITTIEALFEEREVPKEKFEHLSKMLHLSRKMADSKTDPEDTEDFEAEVNSRERLDLFSYLDPNDQMLIANRLAKENIRPYIHEIKLYLQSEEGHPFQKSMLLNILREQEYDKEVEVEKLGMKASFIPETLPELYEIEMLREILIFIEVELEHDDPVLYENIRSLIERNFFLLYPFDPKPDDAKALAAAYHYLARNYMGVDEEIAVYVEKYDTSVEKTVEAVDFIKKIEEISSPII